MKRVITYGTFDLLHHGHHSLLKKARELGDYLIVAVSTDEFNYNEKHKEAYLKYEDRKSMVEALKFVDLVIPEKEWSQKLSDIKQYDIDVFVMGDDWKGKFDYLEEEGIQVEYIPRIPVVNSTLYRKALRNREVVENLPG